MADQTVRQRDRAPVKKASATNWNAAPFVLGAMSSAAPGWQPSRKILTEPVGCLFLAGEATHETLWGTVDGAWESGERAAEAALRKIGALRDTGPAAPAPVAKRRRRAPVRPAMPGIHCGDAAAAEGADFVVERQGQCVCAARGAARG